jgi:hypothetical protein
MHWKILFKLFGSAFLSLLIILAFSLSLSLVLLQVSRTQSCREKVKTGERMYISEHNRGLHYILDALWNLMWVCADWKGWKGLSYVKVWVWGTCHARIMFKLHHNRWLWTMYKNLILQRSLRIISFPFLSFHYVCTILDDGSLISSWWSLIMTWPNEWVLVLHGNLSITVKSYHIQICIP